MLLPVLIAASLASVVDLLGLILIGSKWAKRAVHYLLAFAAGVLLSAAFLDLIPEGLEGGGSLVWVLVGFVAFYILEKALVLQHCHDEHCDIHTGPYLITIGDFFHDFLDGVIIAVAFLASRELGIVTAFAVALHEIPAGFGSFSILAAGSPGKTLVRVFVVGSSLAAPIGAVLAFWGAPLITPWLSTLLLLIAGGFIYISAVNLIPETHKEFHRLPSVVQLGLFLLGLVSIWLFGSVISVG